MSFGDVVVVVVVVMGAIDNSLVSQQNVSLFHNRQLRFSNLRPCSTESAHLEKTIAMVSSSYWGALVS